MTFYGAVIGGQHMGGVAQQHDGYSIFFCDLLNYSCNGAGVCVNIYCHGH